VRCDEAQRTAAYAKAEQQLDKDSAIVPVYYYVNARLVGPLHVLPLMFDNVKVFGIDVIHRVFTGVATDPRLIMAESVKASDEAQRTAAYAKAEQQLDKDSAIVPAPRIAINV
jgi:ABC-type oligopeptide transport system substrate-binding subunit